METAFRNSSTRSNAINRKWAVFSIHSLTKVTRSFHPLTVKICAAHGQCHQQSLVFKVLRNKGDERCEDWAVDQIHVSHFLLDTVFLISTSDPSFLPMHIESNFVAAFQTSTGSLIHLTVFILSLCNSSHLFAMTFTFLHSSAFLLLFSQILFHSRVILRQLVRVYSFDSLECSILLTSCQCQNVLSSNSFDIKFLDFCYFAKRIVYFSCFLNYVCYFLAFDIDTISKSMNAPLENNKCFAFQDANARSYGIYPFETSYVYSRRKKIGVKDRRK